MIITNAIVTAYCACHICCGSQAKGICADGKKPTQGITIAASRRIPLGTKVAINGHIYTVEDRLAARFDNRFDIFFNSHKDALQFGKQHLNVTIITK